MKLINFLFFLLFTTAVTAQEQQLANDYYRKGDYKKASELYKNLFDTNQFNTFYLKRLLICYQQIGDYIAAETALKNQLQKFPKRTFFHIELGYNYQLQDQNKKATEHYNIALRSVEENPNYGLLIGKTFQNNQLLNYALEAYQKAKTLKPSPNYDFNIASIYGEKGELEKMFSAYLNMVDSDEKHISVVQRYIGRFITDDNENKHNILFKKLLLKRLQGLPKNAWNKMLSWLFIYQKDYDKALVQEIALYKRNPENMNNILDLGITAFENSYFEVSEKCFQYILNNSILEPEKLKSHLFLLRIAVATDKDLAITERKFQQLFTKYGTNTNTVEIQVTYADFLSFKKNQPQQAITVLKEALKHEKSIFRKGIIKTKMADVLVYTGKFNKALIYYSQVQTSLKNHYLGQQARFKVAQTSYFKGDFKWAQTQLKVLKTSTSQLIANDALDLSLLITDNSTNDSLQTALKTYAKAGLLAFQNKNYQAIDTLNTILKKFKGHAIEDETLFKQAEIFEKTNKFSDAENNYLKIIELNQEGILVDDALYKLAKLYNKTNNKEKASHYYQKIIFDFPSSIYLVDARKKYRQLRGEDIR